MIYRTILFKQRPDLIYALEHQGLFGLTDELMIQALLQTAGAEEIVFFDDDPREALGAIKQYYPQTKHLFFLDRQTVLFWECRCGDRLPRSGGEDGFLPCRCGKEMYPTADIAGCPARLRGVVRGPPNAARRRHRLRLSRDFGQGNELLPSESRLD